MTVLSAGYTKLKDVSVEENTIAEQYKEYFRNRNIDGAQDLVETNCPFLAMKASDLNDLCDTINYMQAFWAQDKELFGGKYFSLGTDAETYDPSTIYNIGDFAIYNSNTYLCIVDNTTGAFDITKWLLITPNNLGLNIKGLYDDVATYYNKDVTYFMDDGVAIWQVYDGSSWTEIATTQQSIRYLSNPSTAYNDEICIVPYNE